jgi:hypothetical protein
LRIFSVSRASCSVEPILSALVLRGEPGPSTWARFNTLPDRLAWYHGALVEVFVRRHPGPMARQYAEVVARLDWLVQQV